jgi:hypothetical protein
MKKIVLTAVVASLGVALLSGCDKESRPASAATAASSPQVNTASSSTTPDSSPAPAAPAQPSHNYALNQDGTYGYEPALSEDDVRSGKATKALVMMRYVGLRNGTYVLLMLDENNPRVANRITCQAPCNFAKSEIMAGDVVVRTETMRVVPNSLIGAMLQDAIAGQLTPYGQPTPSMPQDENTGTTSSQQQAQLTPPASAQGEPSTPPQATQAKDGTLQQTSFDCGTAKSLPEYLICHDPDLAASDRDLAVVYQQAKDAVADKAAFAERVRKQWNFREKNCHDKECLVSWYAYQKRVLTKIAQSGDPTAQDD